MRIVEKAKNPNTPTVHRFAVGQMLSISASSFDSLPVGGLFRVTALMPSRDGKWQYRVKHEMEAFERVISEERVMPQS